MSLSPCQIAVDRYGGALCETCNTTAEDAKALRDHCRRMAQPDATNPAHYRQHPSGVECITIAEAFNYRLGNVVKYVWRAGLKSPDALTDLRKARWYLDREIAAHEASAAGGDA